MSYEISKYPVEKLDPNSDIQPGFAFKSASFTDKPEDIPLVKGENVHQGYIDWLGAKRWPVDEYASLEKYHLVPGDIVLAMDRPWVTAGLKWSYIKPHEPEALLVQRVARIRAKKNLSQDYLRHVISSNYFSNYLQPIVTGVNVPHISGKQIGAFQIPIPKPETQRKIAAILTAYDDLIEVNKRRIALLEKMAEELYREWFVRMRFPGHQNTRFVKGVPEGWTIRPIGDLCSTVTDGSHFSPPFAESGKPMASVKDMHTHGFDLMEQYEESADSIFQQIGGLLKANTILTKTRDLLLPRLISGKLPVDDLDIQFPPGMQGDTGDDAGISNPRRSRA